MLDLEAIGRQLDDIGDGDTDALEDLVAITVPNLIREVEHLRGALNSIAPYPDAWHHAQETLKRLQD